MQQEAPSWKATGGRDEIAKPDFATALFAHPFQATVHGVSHQGGRRIPIAFNLRKEPLP